MVRAKEIREMSTAEIQSKLDDAREELFNLRFQRAAGQLKDTSRLTAVKRDIARYLTVLNERRILQEWEAATAAAEAAEGSQTANEDEEETA